MMSLKPWASVPHESVRYLRVTKLVRVKRTPSVPKVCIVFSHDKFAWKDKSESYGVTADKITRLLEGPWKKCPHKCNIFFVSARLDMFM